MCQGQLGPTPRGASGAGDSDGSPNNPEKHFSYSHVEAGDITSLFLWAPPCLGKRGSFSGSNLELRSELGS